jgi:WD40 repeat protein
MASGAELVVRPGFNLESSLTGHTSAIRLVCSNAGGTSIFSVDDKTLRAWRTTGQATVRNELVFPSYQTSFVTAMMCTPEPLNALFVACLDGQLRIYTGAQDNRHCICLAFYVILDWSVL